jgi:hypothetical protein
MGRVTNLQTHQPVVCDPNNHDQWSITSNANLGRSIFLGDQLKGPYTAHIGFLSVKLRF